MTEQELKHQIAEIIAHPDTRWEQANQIIKFLREQGGYVQLDSNQNLPELHLPTLTGNRSLEISMESFAKKIRNDMLDYGFRRIKIVATT